MSNNEVQVKRALLLLGCPQQDIDLVFDTYLKERNQVEQCLLLRGIVDGKVTLLPRRRKDDLPTS